MSDDDMPYRVKDSDSTPAEEQHVVDLSTVKNEHISDGDLVMAEKRENVRTKIALTLTFFW